MTFDPMRKGRSNRDRRDQAFARSIIAEAERRRRACTRCGVPLNETDIGAGYCTQCKEPMDDEMLADAYWASIKG